jgi:hypothetical protein
MDFKNTLARSFFARAPKTTLFRVLIVPFMVLLVIVGALISQRTGK